MQDPLEIADYLQAMQEHIKTRMPDPEGMDEKTRVIELFYNVPHKVKNAKEMQMIIESYTGVVVSCNAWYTENYLRYTERRESWDLISKGN